MATQDEMRKWFEGRYETAVDAWFYDTKLTDLQRVDTPVNVERALGERFPESAPEDIEALAKDLDLEGSWLDVSAERPPTGEGARKEPAG